MNITQEDLQYYSDLARLAMDAYTELHTTLTQAGYTTKREHNGELVLVKLDPRA
jgi:hypothetical protein